MIDENTLSRMLVRDEANKQFPYLDSVGKWTVGVGRNLTDKGLSQDEILLMLSNDMNEVSNEMAHFSWFTALDDARQLVIANMAFNLGTTRLLKFKKMIQAIREGNFDHASAEMLDSKWALQVGNRAKRLSWMMRTGEIHTAYLE